MLDACCSLYAWANGRMGENFKLNFESRKRSSLNRIFLKIINEFVWYSGMQRNYSYTNAMHRALFRHTFDEDNKIFKEISMRCTCTKINSFFIKTIRNVNNTHVPAYSVSEQHTKSSIIARTRFTSIWNSQNFSRQVYCIYLNWHTVTFSDWIIVRF